MFTADQLDFEYFSGRESAKKEVIEILERYRDVVKDRHVIEVILTEVNEDV